MHVGGGGLCVARRAGVVAAVVEHRRPDQQSRDDHVGSVRVLRHRDLPSTATATAGTRCSLLATTAAAAISTAVVVVDHAVVVVPEDKGGRRRRAGDQTGDVDGRPGAHEDVRVAHNLGDGH